MNWADYAVYFRTAKHLHLSQLLWRLWYTAERRSSTAFRLTRKTCEPAALNTERFTSLPPEPASTGATGIRLFNELRLGQLTCANLALPFHAAHPNWRLGPQQENRLAAVTLHYHRWVFELLRFAEQSTDPTSSEANELAMRLLDDWLDQCGQYDDTTRHLAWNSFAIATRIGWWVRILHLPMTDSPAWSRLRERMVASLWRQCEHLHQHIEWDLRANHLFRDSVGLAWGASFFRGGQAERWRSTAARIARSQIDEQVLPDGCHFERSPMYHLEWMRDLSTLSQLLKDDQFAAKASEASVKMRDALNWMTHPDGSTVQWNDGRRCRPDDEFDGSELDGGEIEGSEVTAAVGDRSAGRLAGYRGGRWLGHAGLAVWRGDVFHVFFDMSSLGPSCQPGHAHASTLAVECSFRGQRLFVDPGNSTYDDTELRRHERSTSAHNTITCDRDNSSEVWHIFRVGRRARVRNAEVLVEHETMRASAEHDGYRSLADRPMHRRTVTVGHDASLSIRDTVNSGVASPTSGEHCLEGGWLLEPGWKAETTATGWRLEHANVELIEVVIDGPESLRLSVEEATVHPNYHEALPTERLVWRWTGQLPFTLGTIVESASQLIATPSKRIARPCAVPPPLVDLNGLKNNAANEERDGACTS